MSGVKKFEIEISPAIRILGLAIMLSAVLGIAACSMDLTSSAGGWCPPHDQNTATNACKLDGITVKGGPTDDGDDDEDDTSEDDEDEGGSKPEDDNDLPEGGRPRARCGDARDALLQEYIDQGITNAGIADECEDFYFVEPEFNQPRDNRHQPWGLENATVRGVFDGARAEYGTRYGGTITVTGGYRSPAKNAKLPKASKRSHHIFGQAIDMRGNWARGATSARAREEFYRLRRLFPVGTTVCATEWDRYVDDRHLHISLKEKACRGGGNRMGVVVADASPQDVPSRAEQKALARDLRSGDAERVMEAAYRLYDVAAEEWDSDFRRAVADVYVRETKADFARRVLSGDEALTLRDMVWSIAFAGDPVVIPALLLTPTSPNALYQLGEPAFRAVLDMVLSSSPGQFAEDRGRGVTPTMYAGGLDALVMFVDNDGIDDFDGLAQSQLRAVALRTLQSARRGWMMIAAMPLAVAVDDAAAIAMVEALTDKAEIRARGVTHPGEIDMIAQKAREALTGRKR